MAAQLLWPAGEPSPPADRLAAGLDLDTIEALVDLVEGRRR
ncbi:MAG: hypothetical protein ACRDPO_04065 [Streptosporangiaceae bacterium]